MHVKVISAGVMFRLLEQFRCAVEATTLQWVFMILHTPQSMEGLALLLNGIHHCTQA